MLQTQIAYWAMQENKRHNIVSEKQNASQITEIARHNRVTEDQGFRNIKETQWYNRNVATKQAAASMTSAQAALQNAKVNRINALVNAAHTSANIEYIKENTRFTANKADAVKHQTAQGYINSASNVANSAIKAYRLMP